MTSWTQAAEVKTGRNIKNQEIVGTGPDMGEGAREKRLNPE